MRTPPPRTLALTLALAALVGMTGINRTLAQDPQRGAGAAAPPAMQLHYLEIVSPDADATCAALAAMHGATFDAPIPELGNARITTLAGGAILAVRAPMHEQETPVVRPYARTDDLDAAVKAAEAAGAMIAIPDMEIPGRGRIAVYFLGGNQFGLWQR